MIPGDFCYCHIVSSFVDQLDQLPEETLDCFVDLTYLTQKGGGRLAGDLYEMGSIEGSFSVGTLPFWNLERKKNIENAGSCSAYLVFKKCEFFEFFLQVLKILSLSFLVQSKKAWIT